MPNAQDLAGQWSANIANAFAQDAHAAQDAAFLHGCQKSAEWGWRNIELPAGVSIVGADEELKIVARGKHAISFARSFQFSENGEVKDAVYSVSAYPSGCQTSGDEWVDADGNERAVPFDEREYGSWANTPNSLREQLEMVAFSTIDCVDPADGIEIANVGIHSIRLDDDLIIAEAPIRYWVPDESGSGREFALLPELGVHRVVMDKDTRELIAVECHASDGWSVIGTFNTEFYVGPGAEMSPYTPRGVEASAGLKM